MEYVKTAGLELTRGASYFASSAALLSGGALINKGTQYCVQKFAPESVKKAFSSIQETVDLNKKSTLAVVALTALVVSIVLNKIAHTFSSGDANATALNFYSKALALTPFTVRETLIIEYISRFFTRS